MSHSHIQSLSKGNEANGIKTKFLTTSFKNSSFRLNMGVNKKFAFDLITYSRNKEMH